VRAAVWAAMSCWLIGSARAQDAVDMKHKLIQIPPEALRLALPELGEIEGLNIVFLSEDLGNKNTSGVSGNFSFPEALEHLLRGTSLTYRFLEPRTVMILPAAEAHGLLADHTLDRRSPDDAGSSAALVGSGSRLAQVTVTAARPSDSEQLESFRRLDAMSREEYKKLVQSLPFTDSVTVKFPGTEAQGHRLTLGQHTQSASIDGITVTRVFNFKLTEAETKLQLHNNNTFPVFVEVDLWKTVLGDGAYVTLGPGETAFWSWPPTFCVTRGIVFRVLPAQCYDYAILPTTAQVWILKKWTPPEL
jgi:hypothetical protein